MYKNLRVGAVIPALDEEKNIGVVVGSLLALHSESEGQGLIDDLVVCDNGSADATAEVARQAGARVISEPVAGYGMACLTAIRELREVDVALFVDGDQSCHVEQSEALLAAIAAGADLAVGSRVLGKMERGALSIPQLAGNHVASLMIRVLWGHRITDLGPFRAIRTEALERIEMRDEAYGWTVEMQVKAIQHGLRIAEVPVDTARRRYGKSKVGGTLKGIIGASVGILSTILKLRLKAG
ncbi:MAG: glycosyltransferase family 2 protein [Gammaproteobacteria bacterium]|nr:glycosyltransferase family 2 protein [Gammaproteobacteria bacterium]MCY3687513.1 glycosyltransferase family 2 protein [Gammaproteobacteria bacterium]MXY90055.1 glycosyltransferase family 2 protein [Gammaproteobacteria bacterium]MYG96711.1 glycosyltransferase family 2 protein [Gammaproteobacteria bacterium]